MAASLLTIGVKKLRDGVVVVAWTLIGNLLFDQVGFPP
jgi:hypothetical protein